jgi:hypothetical protein
MEREIKNIPKIYENKKESEYIKCDKIVLRIIRKRDIWREKQNGRYKKRTVEREKRKRERVS